VKWDVLFFLFPPYSTVQLFGKETFPTQYEKSFFDVMSSASSVVDPEPDLDAYVLGPLGSGSRSSSTRD
jgi:hypothetical protein